MNVLKMNVLKNHCCLCMHQFKIKGTSYCKKFKYIVIPEHPIYKELQYNIDTVTCRKEEELCGEKGKFFEKIK